MRTYRKHNSIVTVAAASLVAALGAISPAAFAQDSSGAYANQGGSDAEVAARVQGALHANPTLDARHINVAVEHGEVHLTGFVQDNRTLLEAGQVATKAAGERKIINELIIKQNFANAP
jgi:hypothetical protein